MHCLFASMGDVKLALAGSYERRSPSMRASFSACRASFRFVAVMMMRCTPVLATGCAVQQRTHSLAGFDDGPFLLLQAAHLTCSKSPL